MVKENNMVYASKSGHLWFVPMDWLEKHGNEDYWFNMLINYNKMLTDADLSEVIV